MSSKLENEKQFLDQIRLAQMGEMISMLAHQWRQPLQAIASTSGLLQVKAELGTIDNNFVKEKASLITDYTQDLSNTINNFRDFFKPDSKKNYTDFNKIVSSVLSILEASSKTKNITIETRIESINEFSTYTNELKQVILNLIQNAQDVLIEKKIASPKILISSYFKDEKNILEVSDNGGGITDCDISKIFDPYFSTKIEKNGTGLGLYMCKTIIEKHCDGKIIVLNSNDGAMFRIVL